MPAKTRTYTCYVSGCNEPAKDIGYACELQEEAEKHLHDFWLKPYNEQMRLAVKYGEPPEPLTDEEKQEMADCGC